MCVFYMSLCVCLASLLKALKHANIVVLHDIVHTRETLTLVFEYVVRNKLILVHSFIKGLMKYKTIKVWFFFFCVAADRPGPVPEPAPRRTSLLQHPGPFTHEEGLLWSHRSL